jgi:excisionase family DNA binding protein
VAKLLTAARAANKLGCSPAMCTKLARSGELATIRIGRHYRFPQEALNAFISRGGCSRAGKAGVRTQGIV